MDGEIYVGGAVDGDGSVFCPTLAKFNEDLTTLRWSYKTNGCTTGA